MALTQQQRMELKRTVAEAMGWANIRPARDSMNPELHLPDWHFELIGDPPRGAEGVKVRLYGSLVPDFPNDPAQIGPMLERLRRWVIKSQQDGWQAHLCSNGNEGVGEAPTLELAICLAIADYVRAGQEEEL